MASTDGDLLKQFQKILKMSSRIKKSEVAKMLGIAEDALLHKLLEWNEKVPFKIDGEMIVVDDTKAFLAAIDQQFAEWGTKEASKDGKIAEPIVATVPPVQPVSAQGQFMPMMATTPPVQPVPSHGQVEPRIEAPIARGAFQGTEKPKFVFGLLSNIMASVTLVMFVLIFTGISVYHYVGYWIGFIFQESPAALGIIFGFIGLKKDDLKVPSRIGLILSFACIGALFLLFFAAP